ncbi:MAG TPA: LuxR C-terminal-related transcriptional regulator [Acidimicrobiales bacterium]|nr:LuxR C-terminal-related transcriptional regulator [Acidimicrobiales bacterium]
MDDRRAGYDIKVSEPEGGVRSSHGAGSKLPLSLTELIGRQGELAAVADLLSRYRLVTVIGPGGVGKTRLALAVASRTADAYRDGAVLSELAEVADLAALWANVAAALGLTSDGSDVSPRGVVAHLRTRHLLLMLDSCEHLRSECADLAVSVTRACPDVSLLFTSQRALGVVGERVWPLMGLPVDGEDDGGPPTASPAVRLFIERAQAQRPDYAITEEGSFVVTELCRRLDGLPIAIELAAARVGVLSPSEILARLDDRFVLLSGGSATAPDRHQSLAATMRWSHDLLSGPEVVMFRRLGVFPGSFDLAAAEAVCASPPFDDESVLELIASLVAKSLVVADATGDETRYRLLESTREYAARQLVAAGEAGGMRERHAAWFLALAEEAAREVRGASPAPWLARLAADQDNVEAAFDWTVRAERTDWALAIASAMAVFWRRSDLLTNGVEWLAKALALPGQPAALRVEALLAQGLLIGESGDRRHAIGPLEEALQLAEDAGDAGAEARALNLLGYFRTFVDVPTTVLPSLERSTARAQAAGDRVTVLQSLSSAGWVAVLGGDARVADVRFRECLAMAEADERRGVETWAALVGLGWATLTQGRLGDAEANLFQALETASRRHSKHAQAVVWCFLGQLARARGDYGRASALLTDSLSHARETSNPFAVPVRLALLGGVAHDRGDLEGAAAALTEALTVVGSEVPFAHAQCLVALGGVRLSQGQLNEAASLLDDGQAVAEAHGLDGIMVSSLLEQARLRRLGGDLHDAARVAIRTIDLQVRLGDSRGLVDALEVLAGVRAGQGRGRTACRLFAAAQTARSDGGLVRPPLRLADYEVDVGLARSGLGAGEWDAMWAGGQALSTSGAAALAVKSNGRRDSATTGWDAITPTEREVVTLVAQGLTNREAATRLVISPRTVETHVAHVLAKVGIASRRELARVACAKGF